VDDGEGRPAVSQAGGEAPEDGAAQEGEAAGARATPAFTETGFSEEIFARDVTFESMGLRSSVLKGLAEAGFSRPTKIQALMIPRMLAGVDMLGQARTGTGKTGAFGLPLLHMVNKDVPSSALILVPTRELCVQVADEINLLGAATPIRALAVYGGQRIKSQVDALKRGPQIIVSTPGRLMDMVERGYVSLKHVRHVVLDEVDRMLDIGFRDDIRHILRQCPAPGPRREDGSGGRQTVFVSATLPTEVERLARSHSHEAEKVVAVVEGPLTNSVVKQWYLSVNPWDKRRLLHHLLTHEEPDLTLVFCRTKRTVDELAKYLSDKGIDAHAMHGDMYQNKRLKVMERLHKGELSVLVASDLASRGLDVDGITHVVNYDLPDDPEVYVHRIGRTARIGREGVAWAFVMPDQGELLTGVENLINAEIPKLDYPDFKPSEPPRGREVQRPAPKPANQVNRIAATVAPPLPPVQAVADASKFPGGIVPSKMPANRMFGKVKTSRGLAAAQASAPTPPPQPAPPSAPGDGAAGDAAPGGGA
jgi:ATP-dependent RNA helicase DeaD